LNPYRLLHTPLKRARLPFRHPDTGAISKVYLRIKAEFLSNLRAEQSPFEKSGGLSGFSYNGMNRLVPKTVNLLESRLLLKA
jgi:hypothetical protein